MERQVTHKSICTDRVGSENVLLVSCNCHHLDRCSILGCAQVVLTGAQKLLNHSVH